ncbi:MAG TPA: serine/threonine protein kinase [Pseudomonadota bacterium]|nr:serine/threonine protein kinase [Pseudomonadota bacterium]
MTRPCRFATPDFLPVTAWPALREGLGAAVELTGTTAHRSLAAAVLACAPPMEFFYSLTPEAVLDAVEAALGAGARATGRCLVLNSLENRVYDVELEDGGHVIGKFYRPGRWGQAALLDEHRFLHDLQAAEVPAVAPLPLAHGSTLAQTSDGIYFALFPKVRGRSLQELSPSLLRQVGRFLARIHNVGASAAAPHRLQLTVESFAEPALATLLDSDAIDIQVRSRYERAARAILAKTASALSALPRLRIHGDCHLGNLLFHEEAPLFLDFDDMLCGPAVQDVWMIVRGRDPEAQAQRAELVAGYREFREFDASWLRLVEPLRALRMLHFSAWIARRWADPIFPRTFPDFTTYRYWLEEATALEEQLRFIESGS